MLDMRYKSSGSNEPRQTVNRVFTVPYRYWTRIWRVEFGEWMNGRFSIVELEPVSPSFQVEINRGSAFASLE